MIFKKQAKLFILASILSIASAPAIADKRYSGNEVPRAANTEHKGGIILSGGVEQMRYDFRNPRPPLADCRKIPLKTGGYGVRCRH